MPNVPGLQLPSKTITAARARRFLADERARLERMCPDERLVPGLAPDLHDVMRRLEDLENKIDDCRYRLQLLQERGLPPAFQL